MWRQPTFDAPITRKATTIYDSGEVQLKACDTGGSDQNRDQYLKDITAEDNNREAELTTPLSK